MIGGNEGLEVESLSSLQSNGSERDVRYDAFISYSRERDGELAPVLQNGVEKYAKPWNRLRALRVFRDQTNLRIEPALWPSIVDAMSQSSWFVLLASPAAAGSEYVDHEVKWWLDNRTPTRLLLVVTDGTVEWDRQHNDFDWARSSALPPSLRGGFTDEPRWVDASFRQDAEQLSNVNPRLQEAIIDIAATIRGIDKDELVAAASRERRRTRRLVRSVQVALGALLLGLIAATTFALVQRSNAISNQKLALSRALAGEASDAFNVNNGQPDRGVLLSLEGYRQAPTEEARASVLTALEYTDRVDGFIPVGNPVRALTYSPDGRVLTAAGQTAFAAQRWGPRSLRRLGAAVPVDPSMDAFALSPNGRFVVELRTGGVQSQLRQVLVRDLTAAGSAPVALTAADAVSVAAVTNAGEVVIGTGSGIEVWSLASRTRILGPLLLGSADLSTDAVTASGDGSIVAAMTGNGRIVVINVARRRYASWRVAGLTTRNGYEALSLSADGTLLAAGFAKGYFVLWRIDAGGFPHQLGPPQAGGSTADVSALRFDASDRFLAVGKADGRVELWRVGGPSLMFLREDALEIDGLAFNPAGTQVAIGGADGRLTLWNIVEPGGRYVSPLADLLSAPDASGLVTHVAFSPSGAVFAASGGGGVIRLYDAGSGQPLGQAVRAGRAGVDTMTFDPTGRRLLALGDNGVIHAFGVGDSGLLRPLKAPSSAGPRYPQGDPISALSPDGITVAVVTASGDAIALIDLRDPLRAPRLLHYSTPGHRGSVVLEFNRDGTVLASGNGDDSLDLWNLRQPGSGAVQLAPAINNKYTALAFSPDGRTLAAANESGTFALFNLATHQTISGVGTAIGALGGWVATLQFSPDGAVLATGDSSGYLWLWDVARGQQLGRALLSTDQQGAGIGDLGFSPDGAQLAIAGADGTLLRWSRLLWPGTAIGPRRVRLCTISGRNLSRSEWPTFVPGSGYHATCPQWG